jgi:hypothetical protein
VCNSHGRFSSSCSLACYERPDWPKSSPAMSRKNPAAQTLVIISAELFKRLDRLALCRCISSSGLAELYLNFSITYEEFHRTRDAEVAALLEAIFTRLITEGVPDERLLKHRGVFVPEGIMCPDSVQGADHQESPIARGAPRRHSLFQTSWMAP